MRVRLSQTGMHAPWKEGEIVTLTVTADEGDGMYLADTLETYPADLKQRHADELSNLHATIAAKDDHIAELTAPKEVE